MSIPGPTTTTVEDLDSRQTEAGRRSLQAVDSKGESVVRMRRRQSCIEAVPDTSFDLVAPQKGTQPTEGTAMKSRRSVLGWRAAVAAAWALLLGLPVAQAAPVRIALTGIVFDDGGTVVDGSSFVMDPVAQVVTEIDVATSVGVGPPFYLAAQPFPARSGFAFNAGLSCFSPASCGSSTLGDITVGLSNVQFSSQFLAFSFEVQSDGALHLIGVLDDHGAGGYRGAGTQAHPAFAQNASLGAITVTPFGAVPEPGTWALVGLALALAGRSGRPGARRCSGRTLRPGRPSS